MARSIYGETTSLLKGSRDLKQQGAIGMNDWDFAVLSDEEDAARRKKIIWGIGEQKRQAMILARRVERREVEWAHFVTEWAWFAGPVLFLLGLFLGFALDRG